MSRDERTVSYDLHGFVRVRLIDPAPKDRAAIDRRIGRFRTESSGTADVTVRFVDHVPADGVRWVEVGSSGFSERDFLIWPDPGGGPVRLPMDGVGRNAEATCEHGVRVWPLLSALIRATALEKGFVPIHGSAFSIGGRGIITTGWSKGGKTSALLAFATHGAEFVGDDVLFLGPGGDRVFGLSSPIPLTRQRIRELSHAGEIVGSGRKGVQRSVAWLSSLQRTIPNGGSPLAGVSRITGKLVTKLEGRSRAPVRPEDLFPGGASFMAEPALILVMVSHVDPAIVIEPAGTEQVVGRVTAAANAELEGLLRHYRSFRFAFPERMSPVLDQLDHRSRALIERAVAGLEAVTVRHPREARLDDLHRALAPLVYRAGAVATEVV